jgi:hypothetical protein
MKRDFFIGQYARMAKCTYCGRDFDTNDVPSGVDTFFKSYCSKKCQKEDQS